MKSLLLISLIPFLFIISACEKENQGNLLIDNVKGYVQKGPYLNGTAITIFELSDELIPSGRTF